MLGLRVLQENISENKRGKKCKKKVEEKIL
jgi:hypothetical protein